MKRRWLTAWLIVVSVGFESTLSFAAAQDGSSGIVLASPIRLRADDRFIDTGAEWGHSAPCMEDIDGDGLNDLILGDFSGKFRIYRNVGTAGQPSFRSDGLVQAGDADASVLIYCCIGSQARFHDLNGDGHRDLITNSYDPGHCHVFWGLPEHRFAAGEVLVDRTGVPIRSVPVQQQEYQSFGSFYELVDWDDDGDLDILIGCFDGKLAVRVNEGTRTKPEFVTENLEVLSEGEPLRVKAHCCPKVADWDQDGLWDIVAGSDDGSVTFFRNVGDSRKPVFARGETLVAAHDGHGYNRAIWDPSGIVPGIRSQVEVTDFDGDGKLDLILGDFYTAYDFRSDLTDAERAQAESLVAERERLENAVSASREALLEAFAERFPGDAITSDEAQKAWAVELAALQEGPEAKALSSSEATFVKSLRPLLASTRADGEQSFDLAPPHGHVWLYLRQ